MMAQPPERRQTGADAGKTTRSDERADARASPALPADEAQRLYGLVVIGSSAGGIEALSAVLGSLPRLFPLPVVVAQHLDPRQPSHLEEILARRTALPVRTVTDREALAPGTVYVVPADRHVAIEDGHLRLSADTRARPKPSINLLFGSAADAYGERLIAVILTGTGTDGAAGAREVKAAGGTVIIENPETAEYPSMPASLAPTTVDFVANLDQIGPLLVDLVAGNTVAALPKPAPEETRGTRETPETRETLEDERERGLQRVLALVRERNGIDFSAYKRPTILRRLQRRMVATSTSDLPEYGRYLSSHPDEYQRLTTSFLIKVTEFFRDTELFDALRERIIPDLIATARTRGNVLRIWSAGCATGEEAYSLAILIAEALGDELERFQVQIFATDLDEEAVAFARRGIYPGTALAGLPKELVARYFARLDGTYEIAKRLRGMVIFGQHDLGQRPPFPRIDLVLCRNVLIYFTKELQARALQIFAFALRDGGYLALGKAETTHPLPEFFAPIQGSLKLYHRHGERVLGPIGSIADLGELLPHPPVPVRRAEARDGARRRPAPRSRPSAGQSGDQSHQSAAVGPSQYPPAGAERARTRGEWLGNVILGLPIGVVVVDRHYDVQAINSMAMRLLGIYTEALGEDLIHLTQTLPADALRAVIDAAFRATAGKAAGEGIGPAGEQSEGHAAAEAVVTMETVLGERRHLHVACYPYPNPTRTAGGGATSGVTPAAEASGTAGATTRRAAAVEAVLILIEDATGAVTEAQRAEAKTERLRSDQEALATRERNDQQDALRLAQEENARLKAEMERVGAINRSLLVANQDLSDSVLELRHANEELLIGHEEAEANAEEVKTLNEELQATNEELMTLNEELEATVEELHATNDDLQARTQELQRSSEALVAARADAEARRARLEAILLSLGDAVLVVDGAGKALLTNAAYDEMFGGPGAPFLAEDEAGHHLPAAAAPQHRAARGETFTMEFTLTAADATRRFFEASGHPVRNKADAGSDRGGVVVIRDITERSIHRLQDEFVALASHELRTPLTPLSAYLQLLGRLFAGQPEGDRARLYVERAQHEVRRLTRLVQDLLDVRHLHGGGFQVEKERVALDQVVARTVEVAQAITGSQTIHLELPGEPGPVVVEGDAMRLEQVLLNLLTNAMTYAPQSARIDVRLRRSGREAELRVQDYGAGIAAAELPHIFAQFYQVGRGTNRPSRRGLGLGLYIAHELVAAHGGSIEVASTAGSGTGHGTTFTIRLPLAPDETGEQQRKKRAGG